MSRVSTVSFLLALSACPSVHEQPDDGGVGTDADADSDSDSRSETASEEKCWPEGMRTKEEICADTCSATEPCQPDATCVDVNGCPTDVCASNDPLQMAEICFLHGCSVPCCSGVSNETYTPRITCHEKTAEECCDQLAGR